MSYPALPPEPVPIAVAEEASYTTALPLEKGTLTTPLTHTRIPFSTVVKTTKSAVLEQLELDARLERSQALLAGSQSVEPLATLDEPINLSPLSTQLIVQAPDAAGSAPSLQTQPSTPDQKPFQPQNLPFPQGYPTAPSLTVVTPSAYGKSQGSAAVGFGLQAPSDRSSNDVDGGVGVSIGLGDSRQAVGLDVGVSVSVTTEQFAERGSLSAKLHRQLSDDFAIAVGVRSVINLNSDSRNSDEQEVSVYGVVTKQIRLRPNQTDPFSRLYLSAGVGGGQFREQSARENGANSVGVFGSVAVRIAQPLNAIAEWTGQDVILGLSWTPIPRVPLVITPAVDTTGNVAGENRFLLGIGYGFSF
jgi:hypothetical protein